MTESDVPHICIVTPGQLGTNPRTVKEADALVEAGYRVTVISTKLANALEARSQAILATARWQPLRLDFASRRKRLPGKLIQQFMTWLFSHAGSRRAAFWAHNPMTRALTRAAMSVRADLYIGHYVATLPAVAAAANRYGTPFAFDAEDFHPGDLADVPENQVPNRLIAEIEGKLLPAAAYVTAASPGIASAYAKRYPIVEPRVVLNTFSRNQAPAAVKAPPPSPSIYWFSQVIGGDRGLECAVQAIAMSRYRPRLCLRGSLQQGYLERLHALAEEHGVAGRLEILPPALPNEMEVLAADHSIGLASETPHTPNHRIALANKLFTYLLAGIPTLMSDIDAHRDFAVQTPGASFIYQSEDPASLADAMDALLGNPDRLIAARRTAYELGQTRFNWEVEQVKLLASVRQALRHD